MSRSLGSQLPEILVARLLSPGSTEWLGRVVVLATVDPYGWPHPALLSYAELRLLDPGRFRLALQAGSRSARHLRESGRATLVFAEPEVILYVKAEAVGLPDVAGHSEVARFELDVRDVLEDRAEGDEAGIRLISGLTVEWPAHSDSVAQRRARVLEILAD